MQNFLGGVNKVNYGLCENGELLFNVFAAVAIACVTDVIYPLLPTYLPTYLLVLSPQGTQRIAGSTFRISFHPDWQIDNGIF